MALTRIMAQANEDECSPFTIQSPVFYVCLYICVGGSVNSEILMHFKVLCATDSCYGGLKEDIFVVALLLSPLNT